MRGKMTELGYKPIFDIAHEESKKVDYSQYFETFHDHPELFHFIMAPKSQYATDDGQLQLAQATHPDFYTQLYDKGPSLLGNGSTVIDGVESRHILLMTWLIATLGPNWGKVVEIGGGYGNCLRLVDKIVSFDKWAIVDLDYISDLQKWFLTKNSIDLENVQFVHSDDREQQKILEPNLVLGIHSLSEMSISDFIAYYLRIIRNSKWLFYVSQVTAPSPELLQMKLSMINKYFYLSSGKEYEGGSSVMYLFRNKDL